MKHSIELKGASFTLSILKILNNDLNKIESDLSNKLAQAPNFFINTPIVLDLKAAASFADFSAIKELLIKHQLYLVAVSNCQSEEQQQAALAAQLPILNKGIHLAQSNAKSSPKKSKDTKQETEPKAPQVTKTKVINQPVRSGQQIYAANSDLIILGAVSNGAEVAADGNVHVYGTLRGRAIAGAKGDKEAKIFCQNLQAELVSIAGHYCLSDSLEEQLWQEACSLRLVENKIITYKL